MRTTKRWSVLRRYGREPTTRIKSGVYRVPEISDTAAQKSEYDNVFCLVRKTLWAGDRLSK